MIGVVERRLVLGLGGTVDYELCWDAGVFEQLASRYRVSTAELTMTAPIIDERSLLVTILAFAASGSGGERHISSSEVIEIFASRFDKKVTLGGTGVRAGLALERLGVPSTQHLVSIDDNVRALLPDGIDYICSARFDTLDPHLIVQFPPGARIRVHDGDVETPAANRLIFADDAPNREMAIAPELPRVLEEAAVFLISGFNTMQDHALLVRRLDELSAALRSLPSDALVYYEDAGFYRRAFADTVRARLLPRIDVYGMNEDELQEYLGRDVDLLDPDAVVAALEDVRRIIPAPTLVVHTRYWATAAGPHARRYHRALDSAVDVSATRYRLGDAFTGADVHSTAQMHRHPGGEAVVRAATERCTEVVGTAAYSLNVPEPTTIGLGDSFVGGFLAAFAPGRMQSL